MAKRIIVKLLAGAAILAAPSIAAAAPQSGAVIDGAATIGTIGQTTTIDQTSDKAIIDWASFGVLANERVDFNQPSRLAITLNRVQGSGPSQIDGAIFATGRVFLINGDGVVFGADSRIDAAGILATSADIANADFMADVFNFSQPGSPGASIVSLGTIDVREAGMVAFVAPTVRHSGVIFARAGKVALGAGEAFTLDFFGDNLITFAAVSTDGAKSGAIEVDGDITAAAGVIALTATTARDFIDTIINVEGDLVARSATMEGGKIILAGGERTDIAISGALDARGTPGGSITVTGGGIDVAATGELLTDAQTGLADGGDILVNSKERTTFAGLASSEPGAAAGTGGDIAITSDGVVLFSGIARAGTPPRNGTITINGLGDADGDGEVDGGGGSGPPIIAPSPEIRNEASDRLTEVSGAPAEGYGALDTPPESESAGGVVLFETEVAFDAGGGEAPDASSGEKRLLCMHAVAESACGSHER